MPHEPAARNWGFRLVIAALGVCCWAAGVWWWLARESARPRAVVVAQPTKSWQALRAQQDAWWSEAPMVSLGEVDAATLRGWLLAGVRSGPGVPDAQTAALTATIAAHSLARASMNPDDYLRLADAERTRWKPGGHSMAWNAVRERYRFLMKTDPDPGDLRGVLWTLVDAGNKVERSRFVKVAADGPARRIECRRIRSVDEADSGLLQTVEDYEFWTGAPVTNALRLRSAPSSLEEVLARDGWTWYAEVRLVVEVEAGGRAAWCSEWYWDSKLGVWSNRGMSMTSWSLHGVCY